MTTYPYQFEAALTYHDVGSARYAYTVLYVPEEVTDALPKGRLRLTGEINDHPYSGALHPSPRGAYLLLSKTLIKALDLTMGEICDVRFALEDPNAVTLPPALTQALREDDALYALWQAQTPGKQRGLAHMVATAKTPPTQAKRLTTIRGILEGRLDARGKPLA